LPSQGVVLKSIDPNQIFLDRAGTVKLGCFDEAVLVPRKGMRAVRAEKHDLAAGAWRGWGCGWV
jgi:hypothetical protein